jgi:hypothetical protein
MTHSMNLPHRHSLASDRDEAAHGQIEQRLTLRDVRTYRVIIYRLVQKADEYLARIIHKEWSGVRLFA